MGAGFEVAAVVGIGSQAASRGGRQREDGSDRVGRGGKYSRAAIFAGWQMGFVFEAGRAAEVACVCEASGQRYGARDRVGRFSGGVWCEVDTRWTEAAAAGRRWRAGDVRVESHGVAAVQRFIDAE